MWLSQVNDKSPNKAPQKFTLRVGHATPKADRGGYRMPVSMGLSMHLSRFVTTANKSGRAALTHVCLAGARRSTLASPSPLRARWLRHHRHLLVPSGCGATITSSCSLRSSTTITSSCALAETVSAPPPARWLRHRQHLLVRSGCDITSTPCLLTATTSAPRREFCLHRHQHLLVRSGCDITSISLCSLAAISSAFPLVVWLPQHRHLHLRSGLRRHQHLLVRSC